MIGLDTNVIVRYVVQDDPGQSALANGVFDGLSATTPGFVGLVVIAETHWVLRRRYRLPPSGVAEIVRGLLTAEEIVVERADVVTRALSSAGRGLDFADALIGESGRESGCRTTVTFDRGAAALPGFELVS